MSIHKKLISADDQTVHKIEIDEIDERAKSYIISASVAAELHALTSVARQVSMIAKNARALAIRAGESVAGFKAITGFIEEIAKFSAERGGAIDQMATKISRVTVDIIRLSQNIEKFEQCVSSDVKYAQSMKQLMETVYDTDETLHRQFRRSVRRLKMEINEIGGQLRGVQMMVTSSKVEAAGAGDFKEGLNSVASQLLDAYNQMYNHISKARMMMNEIKTEQI